MYLIHLITMNSPLTWLFALAVVAAATRPDEYLTWAADTFIREGVVKDYHYTTSVLYSGYEAAIAQTQNQTLVDWYQSQIDDAVVLPNGSIADWNLTYYSLDDYRMGNNFLWWYNRTGETKYKIAADTIRFQLNRHPRNSEGGFWHRAPIYANQMWLDGIFMADSFYARWTALFDASNEAAWDHIALQFDLIEDHCRNTTSGLLVHGYDESKTAVWADPITGAAPNVWSRAVGWYLIALLEVLAVFPASHAGKERLLGYFTTLAAAVRDHQDGAGGWWVIMNDPYPGAAGNYIESSASAMFTYGLLRGVKEGHLSQDYYETAMKGYDLLTAKFVLENENNGTLRWEGTVSVGSLNSNGSYEVSIEAPVSTLSIQD